MKKTRINLLERFPLYHAASKQKEKFAELSDSQTETLDSIETHLAELQDEITKLKEDGSQEEEEDTSASEDEKDKTASEDEDEKTASEDEDEKTASEDEDEYMKAAASNARFASLEAKITNLESLLKNKPSSASTVIGANTKSEGEGKGKVKYATSVDEQLAKLRRK